ncbi:uncharacterized protein LOC141641589 [Silene latifolia]|uniref:uncharacterized protein LOC141641589 n=1 Tax=Silene latifolia TaxID=37657 RepID=UPI003D78233A
MLQEIGFPQQFINWVLGCITGTWYSLKLNGGLFGFFSGKDDLMMFVRRDVPSVIAVQHALTKFASVSGLSANNKLQHWSTKSLTYAGKAQLLYAVIFCLENFWCSSMLLTQKVLKQINQLSRNFFWGIKEGERKLQFKSWKHICAPWSRGGFNIKNVQTWNIALMIHWIWKFSTDSTGLWVRWHKEYVLKNETIWSLASKDQFSSSLKGVLAARNVLLAKAGGKLQTSNIYEYLLEAPVPRHRVIAILAAQGKLATVDNLQPWGFHLVNRCSLCKQALESHQHLFFRCLFSQAV